MRAKIVGVDDVLARLLMGHSLGSNISEGYLSRDSRGKERKKYGQKGARKRFQFSKR